MSIDTRTKPLYPTFGPAWLPGVSWHEYMTQMRRAAQPVETEEEVESEPEIEVLVPGRELTADEIASLNPKSRPAQIAKRLKSQGWTVRVKRSLVHVPAVLYKEDSKTGDAQKGDVRYAEHDLETTVLLGVKRAPNDRGGLAVEVTWTSKEGFVLARTYDPYLGHEVRVGYTKGRKQNDIEREDGIQPPLGLGEWLDMMAPTKPKKEEA